MPGKSYLRENGPRNNLKIKFSSRHFAILRAQLTESSRENAASTAAGTRWCTNGELNIRVKLDKPIPTGFKEGRSKLPSRAGVKLITNGIKSVRIAKNATIPEGWSLGASDINKEAWAKNRSLPSAKGRKWINDGYKNRYLKAGESLPDGWVAGRLTIGKFNPSVMRKVSLVNLSLKSSSKNSECI